jgi:hypothetical protein
MLWLVKRQTELEFSPARHDLVKWGLSAKLFAGITTELTLTKYLCTHLKQVVHIHNVAFLF